MESTLFTIEMNIRKTLLTLSLVLLCFLQSLAQANSSYVVLATQGKIYQCDGKRIYAGTYLPMNACLKVESDSSYVAVLNKNGQTIEITKKGTHQLNQLFPKTAIPPANNFFEKIFVKNAIQRLASADLEDISKDSIKYQFRTGSVYRCPIAEIKPLTPHCSCSGGQGRVYNPKVLVILDTFSYNRDISKAPYALKVKDWVDREVYQTIFEGETVKADLTNLPYKYDKFWVLETTSVEDKYPIGHGGAIGVQLLDGEERNAITTELNQLNFGEKVSDKILLAHYFWEKELYYDALREYYEAVQLLPQIDTYQISYKEFIVSCEMTFFIIRSDVPYQDLLKKKE